MRPRESCCVPNGRCTHEKADDSDRILCAGQSGPLGRPGFWASLAPDGAGTSRFFSPWLASARWEAISAKAARTASNVSLRWPTKRGAPAADNPATRDCELSRSIPTNQRCRNSVQPDLAVRASTARCSPSAELLGPRGNIHCCVIAGGLFCSSHSGPSMDCCSGRVALTPLGGDPLVPSLLEEVALVRNR